MKEPLLVLDVNYLAHRAWHAMGALTYNDDGTGALFGVIKDITHFQDMFKTKRTAFCFDAKRNKRYAVLPTYKGSRKAKYQEGTDEDKRARDDLNRQIKMLRDLWLPMMGFSNVFSIIGYEADDVIAKITKDLPEDDEAIIISADHDLYQCLRPNVWIWNAHSNRAYTLELFREQWGIEPDQWAACKAYAGCTTDDVPGVKGVAEPTAAKFLRGELGLHLKSYSNIIAFEPTFHRNMKLVQLPFPGLPEFRLQEDTVSEEKWAMVVDKLGLHSLVNDTPGGVTKKSRGRKRDGYKKEGFGFNRD